jgi:hypothetical protein
LFGWIADTSRTGPTLNDIGRINYFGRRSRIIRRRAAVQFHDGAFISNKSIIIASIIRLSKS